MKLNGILGVSIMLFVAACQSTTNKKDNVAEIKNDTVVTVSNDNTNDTAVSNAFRKDFLNFYLAFKNKDQKTINKYIDPNYGFVIIYSEGAMPQVSSTDNLVDFTTNTDRVIHEFVTFPDINLLNENLPKVDCNKSSFYDKTGSYFSSENFTLQQEMWIYGNFSENEKVSFKKAAQDLTYNVVITGHGRYGVQYSNNKLKVIFIDLRKPCNS